MPSETEVVTIVAQVMRHQLICNTPYRDVDPDEDKRGFRWSLIPSKAEFDGWNANEQAWHTNLGDIATALAKARPSYPKLDFDIPFVKDTLDIEIEETMSKIVDLIREGGDSD